MKEQIPKKDTKIKSVILDSETIDIIKIESIPEKRSWSAQAALILQAWAEMKKDNALVNAKNFQIYIAEKELNLRKKKRLQSKH